MMKIDSLENSTRLGGFLRRVAASAWTHPKWPNVRLWPSVVMFLLLVYEWAISYDEASFLMLFAELFLAIPCSFLALWSFLMRKKLGLFVSFMFPVLLAVGMHVSSIYMSVSHVRHWVEFEIQKNVYIPEMRSPSRLPDYKEWDLRKRYSSVGYSIVFDRKDRVKAKNGTEVRGCLLRVYKVGEHFYVLTEACKDR